MAIRFCQFLNLKIRRFQNLLDDKSNLARSCRTVLVFSVAAVLAIGLLVATSESLSSPVSTTFNVMKSGHRRQVSGLFKKAYENADGSVDVVFNIPFGAEELVKVNVSNTGIDKDVVEVMDPLKGKKRANLTTEVQPRTSVTDPPQRMLYPLSIDGDFVINSPNVCQPGEPLDYLIIVHSATAYYWRRQAMRQTFAAKRLFGKIRQTIVFLLGLTDDPVTTKKIKEEAMTYGDIVQGDFIDSYHNLTHKGVMGYRWIVEYCPQAKLILKIDDDVFFNPFRFIEKIFPMFKNQPRQIACQVRPRDTSPIVRGKGKWQVSDDEFKGLHYYPFSYCNGYFVVMSSELIRPMLQAVRLNPFFWIDDIYLFGMLPATVGKVKYVSLRSNLTLVFKKGIDCYAKKGLDCEYLAVSQWREGEKTTLWHMLLELLPESTKKEFHLIDKS